ncbi:nitroreductase [Chloroflexota bacterium]
MDVIEAILERRSIRSFISDPVPKKTLLKILEVATRAPSSSNTQSWEIFVAGGKVLENIRQAYVGRLEKSIEGKSEIAGTGRDKLPSRMLEGINQLRVERAKAEGLDPAAGNSLNSERGTRFFGAPIVLVLCMNRIMSLFSTYDLGLLTENILLAAQNFDLGSIIAGAIVRHPDILRKELGIPDELLIVEGIALGSPDKQARVNTFRSSRRPIQEVVTFKGL